MPSSVPPQPPPHTPSGRSGSTGGGTPTGRGALPSPLDAGFDTIDTNSDGTVDNAELRAHLQGMGYAESTVKAIFGALDLDVNGEISRDEMVACFARSEYAALRLAIAGNDAVKAR